MGSKSSKPTQEDNSSNARGRRALDQRGQRQQRPKAQISEKDKAILELKAARDKVKRYQIRLENEVKNHKDEAKKYLKQNDKKKAVLLLKISKFKEGQIEKSDAQLLNLIQMVETIEFEETQLQVVQGLDAANKVLKMMHEIMSPEKVDEVMEDMREQGELVDEINQILGANLTSHDEEEVLAELEELELEEAGKAKVAEPQKLASPVPTPPVAQQPVAAPAALNLPEAPTGPVSIPQASRKEKAKAKPALVPAS